MNEINEYYCPQEIDLLHLILFGFGVIFGILLGALAVII